MSKTYGPQSLLIRGLIPLFALALAASACTSGRVVSEDVPTSTVAPPEERASVVTTLPSNIDSDFTDALLADGVVTAAEMERSYQEFVDCLESGGGSGLFAYDLAVGSGISLEWGVFGDDESGALTDSVEGACNAQFLRGIEQVYDSEHPIDASGEEIIRQRTLSCITTAFPELAAELDQSSSYDQILAAADRISENSGAIIDRVTLYDCTLYGMAGDWRSFGDG